MICLTRVRDDYNTLWVIVNRLTKFVHFIPVKNITSINQLSQFVVDLLKVKDSHNILWVTVDQLTNSTHFILIKDTTNIDQLDKEPKDKMFVIEIYMGKINDRILDPCLA